MARDPAQRPENDLGRDESYNTMIDGAAVFIAQGERHRGGPNTAPTRHPQWWLEDGATPTDVARARVAAGIET